jgi:hypothetical protein
MALSAKGDNMGVSMYPVLNADVDWWDLNIDGKALAAAAELLEKIAKKRKVKRLFDFFSMAYEDAIADILGGDPDDPSTFDEAEVPHEQWFEPTEGLDSPYWKLQTKFAN